jgi:hypothetical protein
MQISTVFYVIRSLSSVLSLNADLNASSILVPGKKGPKGLQEARPSIMLSVLIHGPGLATEIAFKFKVTKKTWPFSSLSRRPLQQVSPYYCPSVASSLRLARADLMPTRCPGGAEIISLFEVSLKIIDFVKTNITLVRMSLLLWKGSSLGTIAELQFGLNSQSAVLLCPKCCFVPCHAYKNLLQLRVICRKDKMPPCTRLQLICRSTI